MCFSVIAGKNVTTTGYVILGANDDWPGCPGQIHHQPHKFYNESDTFLTVKGQKIPQLSESYAYTYTVCDYETGTRKLSWADGINENQVAVGMMGAYTFSNFQSEKDVLEADDITILIMERGKTARQAIEMIGELIEKYGFTVSSIDGSEGVATIAVADPYEGFFLEFVPGGLWAAKKVKDDEIECRPNCFGIQEIDFSDHENYLYSSNLKDFAIKNNLYNENEKFNFSDIFGEGPLISESYGGADRKVNSMRRYGCVNRLCGMNHDPSLKIYSGKPDKKLGVIDIMNILRDTFEGSEYDMSKCKEAGIHNNPLWMETSYSIGQGGTVFSMVFELSDDKRLPSGVRSCMWTASAASKLSCYIPVFVANESIPDVYQNAKLGEYNLCSSWWAFQELGQLCYRNYQKIANELVIPKFLKYQMEMIEEKEKLVKEIYQLSDKEKIEKLNAFSNYYLVHMYKKAVDLGKYIKGKYLSNTILTWL